MFSLRSVGLHLNRSITAVVGERASVFTTSRGLASATNANARTKSKKKDRVQAQAFAKANPQIFQTRVVKKKEPVKTGN
jgi:hypothetical protein